MNDKSGFAKEGKDVYNSNDLKLNLSSANQRNDFMTNKIEDKSKWKFDDKQFLKIIKDKRLLDKRKKENKIKELEQIRMRKELHFKKSTELQEKNKMIKRERAIEKIQNIVKKQKEREQMIKSSLSYKYFKGQIPMFKRAQIQREQSLKKEIIKKTKNERVCLNDILKHSKMFESKQMIKQKEREIKIRKAKESNKSIYEILDKLNKMDSQMMEIRGEKMKKIRLQKERVRNYSRQVTSFFTYLQFYYSSFDEF